MAELVPHTVAPGTLAGLPQPTFPLGGGIELRPWAQERRLEWAVAETGGAMLGRLALKDLVLFDGIAEVAYRTVPAARGRGLAPSVPA
jgi:hypothetical protein